MPTTPSEIAHPERFLREMIAEAQTAQEADTSRDALMAGLFPKKEWPTPPPAQFPRVKKNTDRRSDFVIAALGVTLGLICALFPWYIFFNQEQFGVQAIKFGGKGSNSGRIVVNPQPTPADMAILQDTLKKNLDLFSTGHIPDASKSPLPAPGVDQQPFPADISAFHLVHVANGRAMIEDDTGLWLVQQGATLPDSSRVASIEQRGGKWVLVTSTDRVMEISP